jgi:hypothetical protein
VKRLESGDEVAVLVPSDRFRTDFELLLTRAIDDVAAVEGAAPEELIGEITEPDARVIRLDLEIEEAARAGVSLSTTLSIILALREIVWASAAESARFHTSSRAAEYARRYSDEVRLADVALGSLQLSALLPDRVWTPGGGGRSVPTVVFAGLRGAGRLLPGERLPRISGGLAEADRLTQQVVAALANLGPEAYGLAVLDVTGSDDRPIVSFDAKRYRQRGDCHRDEH